MIPVQKFTDIQDSYNNQVALDALRRITGWNICNTRNDPCPDSYSDLGLVCRTFDIMPEELVNSPELNYFAYLVCNKIASLAGIRNWRPARYLWNYYHRSATCNFHQDCGYYPTYDDKITYLSLVYYVNTCDGGTTVESEFFPSIEGNAVLFPSTTLHKGHPPVKDQQRFVLNGMLIVPNDLELMKAENFNFKKYCGIL